VRAGLSQARVTGWDADDCQLAGHIADHHLSAISLMWAATGDKRLIADRIVSERRPPGKGGDASPARSPA
jgi:hypothetical protein